MENRFGDVNRGILGAMRITNFRYWPEADRNSNFGDADVQELITHFEPVVLRSGVKVSDLFSTLGDAELDALVEDVLKRHPNAGHKMMVGHLGAQGIQVQSKAGFVP
ncbi:hypothetical protein DPX16_17854 [Anabarilius grahami]|uniref:Uncharacterized protein n=1 Tax=Anabarilius grahami TaxID=495550 RepID=A0A3N0YGF5_ANAGA|nr:hypothetical protein DPX16_17854 [Anabarilius grahami]